ncbi:polysaccharide biosynthesis protein [Thiopseudomonas alkaliphila]|nr:polysaccharide biosynthesis protein [Thiopseudomonas alkaliphila]
MGPKLGLFSGEAGQIFKGMITLLMGAGLARLLSIISIPILTRIYSPEDYGTLALYTSLIAILIPVLTFRYTQAIPLPRNVNLAFGLLLLCLVLILLWSIVLVLLFVFFGKHVFEYLNFQVLNSWWLLIVLGAVGGAVYETFTMWAVRSRSYALVSKIQVRQSFVGESIKIVLGLLGFKPVGLLVGQAITQSYGAFDYFKSGQKDFKKLLWGGQKTRNFLASLKLFANFPFFRLPSDLLLVLSVQAPLLITAAVFSKEITGQLSLAIMALSLPVSLIGAAISRAYYAEIAALGRTKLERIKKITFSIQKKLFLIGFPLTIVVFFTSEFLFVSLFGDDWLLAGVFSSILSPYVLLQFTSSPLMQVVNVVGRQSTYFYLNLGRVIGLALIYWVAKEYMFSAKVFVTVLSVYLSFYYLVQTLVIMFLISKKG